MKKIMRTHEVVLLFLAILSISGIKMPVVEALTAPFRPADVLPLLPRQISWPILKLLNSATDLLPAFVGAAAGNSSDLHWKGACFYDATAWLQFHNNRGSRFGGGTLHIKDRTILDTRNSQGVRMVSVFVMYNFDFARIQLNKPDSWACMDLYLFATPFRVTWDYYVLSREHTLEFKEWESEAEFEYVKNRGVSIFLMQAGMKGTFEALWEVFPLFTDTVWGENSNIKFLKKHMGANFHIRPQPWVTNINVDEIHSGDFLALSKIRGRWGAFETLEKWVTGAYAGHSAVCLRDPYGKLWVAESGHEIKKGEKSVDIIALVSWDEWWELELTKDDSNPHIALLPLHPDLRAKFNESAAWEFAKSMEGRPYGYHNLIFSWIDTISDNYPKPLDAHLVASFMTVLTQMEPAYAGNMWNEALNKRLGTQNYSLPEILFEVEKRGSSFGQLLAIPEQDNWVYADGKSTSCVAFVFELYKEAGLFGKLASSIQATEFTIKDAYTLKFFEDNLSRLPTWCNDKDSVKLPFCQIKGKYRMELPGYNTMDPYPHMNERCPSLPPDYYRSSGC